MAESKSTDKLKLVKELIGELRKTLDDEQLGRLKEINLDWKAIDINQFDSMPCPTLNIKLYEKGQVPPTDKEKSKTLLLEKKG